MFTQFSIKRCITLFILVLALSACSAPAGGDETAVITSTPSPETNAPAATEQDPTPTATTTALPIGGGGGGSGDGDLEEGSPTEEIMPVGPEGQSLDSCLIGTWTVENDSVAQYLENALNQNLEEPFFFITEITGLMQMSFDNQGQMGVTSADYLIFLLFNPSESLEVDIDMELAASGTASYEADGTQLSRFNQDITVTGSPLDSVLQSIQDEETVVVMEVTPEWFLGEFSAEGEEPSEATYTCSGDSLSITSNEYGPWTFIREN